MPEGGELPSLARDRFGKQYVLLDPAAPVVEAAGFIYGCQLDIIRDNLDGVRSGAEGDYLHDLRVATRRTRTGLRQLKGVYPRGVAKRFAAEFRWIAKNTNTARDLEVFLEARERYASALVDTSPSDLDPLFDGLAARLIDERRAAAELMRSERVERLLEEWKRWIRHDAVANVDDRTAVATVAPAAIRRAHKRVVRWKKRLGEEPDLEALHQLRLQCKKLRYLLEFFRSLFDTAASDEVIRDLRDLQDDLGYLNDLRVQAEWARIESGGAALAEHADAETQRMVDVVLEEFARFVAKDRRQRFGEFLDSAVSHPQAR